MSGGEAGAAGGRIEVLAVAPAPPARGVRGCFLGVPEAGDVVAGRSLTLRGWALPEAGPALGIEVLAAGAVVARSSADLPRPDIAAVHADLPHAGRCGFEVELALAAVAGELDLVVRAVLDPVRRVEIATVTVRVEQREGAAVTVVIPCHRQAHFLGAAIESVLAQDGGRLELVVVDDGSPDNASAVAARYPGVRRLRRPNGGLAAARNTGLEAAGGEFVVFLDADDRLAPGALGRGLEALRGAPEAMMAAGAWRLIGEEGEAVPADPPHRPAEAYPALLESCFISTPAAVIYRRELFKRIGGFDPEVSASADYDLYLRAAARFPVALHDATVAEYRRHGANMTRDPALIMAAEIAVLERRRPAVADRPELSEALERGLARSRDYHAHRLGQSSPSPSTLVNDTKTSVGTGGVVGELAEVLDVVVDGGGLAGASVDTPAAGRRLAARAFEVGGWALGPEERPRAVEAVWDGEVVGTGDWGRREDLAAALPEAADTGFELTADLTGASDPGSILELRARLGDEEDTTFARLRLRRYWRGAPEAGELPLVAIVVLDEGEGVEAVERTLAGVAAQRHPLTEVLVLGPGEEGQELRAEGLRRSNGELVLFLPAGRRLAPDALALGVEMLARRPDASALIDGDRDDVVVLYRRAACAELGGFAPGHDDRDLARRMAARGAILARGVLVAAGG
ncbi:MAG: glycosyltransferase [Actinobacteria bacterium]|nr:glycosyltransferase [Actinomycetota bacterium]